MSSQLPLEVLGLMAPVLCWVEGAEGLRLPQSWLVGNVSLAHREQAWLIRELPNYSYDNVDEIVSLTRGDGGATPAPAVERLRRRLGTSDLSPPPGYDLAAVFTRLGRRYFHWSGSDLVVREGHLEELHELALRFPVAHLIRHAHARAVASGFITARHALALPEQLSVLSTSSQGLRIVVDRGLSEGHLHLWGVTSADESWADHLLLQLTAAALEGFTPAEERLLVLSRCGLRLLALGLLYGELGLPGAGRLFALLGRLDEMYLARNRAEEAAARGRLTTALEAVLRDSLAAAGDGPRDRPPGSIGWLLRLVDPVAQRLRRARDAHPTARARREGIRERIRLLERLHFQVERLLVERPGTDPRAGAPREPSGPVLREFVHQCFFRYLIYQTHHWQLATQSGKTTGLRQFKRYFGARQREAVDRKGADVQGWIFERLRHSRSLRTVEGRVSPPERGPGELVPWVLGYAQSVAADELEGFGLVIHFIKDEHGTRTPRRAHFGHRTARKGHIRRHTRETAFSLFRLLSQHHPVVPFVVGIDAANLELTTPPEVFAPAFRFLREYPIEVRRLPVHLERFGTHREIASLVRARRLGMTFHVGEDFRHLLSGLRAIDESIEFLKPAPGDRLGHAIALGLDPAVWTSQTGFQAVVPKLEWLDTLVWVYHLLGSGNDLLGRLHVEDRIQQLSWDVYGPSARRRRTPGRGESGWSPLTLYDAWHMRQLDPYSLDIDRLLEGDGSLRPLLRFGPEHRRWAHVQLKVLEDVASYVGSSAAFRLLGWYWFDDGVRRRGDEVIILDMRSQADLWIELCHAVQERIKEVVREHQVVVEVNPSSNRIIGPMARFEDHPIFRLTLDEQGRLHRDVLVTVNTDDPGVFNTSLAHEYYLLGELQMRRGVPEAEVAKWLEWLRSNGNDFSFVRHLPHARDAHVRRVLESLEKSSKRLGQRLSGRDQTEQFWSWFHREPPNPARRPEP